MTIAKKVEVRDFWYSLQDLVGGVLPESKRVELERLIGQVEEEAKKEIGRQLSVATKGAVEYLKDYRFSSLESAIKESPEAYETLNKLEYSMIQVIILGIKLKYKVMEMLKKGQWYYYCCYEDFRQADEDEELDDEFPYTVFNSEIEGLLDCLEMEVRSQNSSIANKAAYESMECKIKEIEQRIISLVNS